MNKVVGHCCLVLAIVAIMMWAENDVNSYDFDYDYDLENYAQIMLAATYAQIARMTINSYV